MCVFWVSKNPCLPLNSNRLIHPPIHNRMADVDDETNALIAKMLAEDMMYEAGYGDFYESDDDSDYGYVSQQTLYRTCICASSWAATYVIGVSVVSVACIAAIPYVSDQPRVVKFEICT